MNALDLIIRELQGATADLKADNDRVEAKPMTGIFWRFFNHQGELRWKFVGFYDRKLAHAHVERFGREAVVHCNIKRAPRIGTYCKAPAHYMRAAA